MPAVRTTPTVRALLIISVAAFLLQLIGDTFLGTHIRETLSLIPQRVFEKHYYWQLFTYIFMHADLFHILFNLLILWMIGSELEGQWGSRFFLTYFLVCAFSAGIFYLAVQAFLRGSQASYIPMMGASGGVYGLLVAYGIIYSERVLLFMMVFPMKAKHFVILLAAIEFIATVFYSGSGIANAAHLGGMAVGFAFLFLNAWWRIRSKQKGKPKKFRKARSKASHLRLVVNNEVLKEFEDDDEEEDDNSEGPIFH
jgi:membrane associated rhomboid family serine protease